MAAYLVMDRCVNNYRSGWNRGRRGIEARGQGAQALQANLRIDDSSQFGSRTTRALAYGLTAHAGGAGGCGKTRLAVHLAANVVQGYPDGCWLVELAALADPGLGPQKVANVLGIKEQSSKSLTESLNEYLAPRHLLLVLDNA